MLVIISKRGFQIIDFKLLISKRGFVRQMEASGNSQNPVEESRPRQWGARNHV